jgi:ABC-type Mn2+/Zn2+ transport system permease subunit
MGESYQLILAAFSAAAAGLVGAFALMKRTILAGDVMSHIALPGLGLAFLFNINPLIGGAATLFLGIILIWKLEGETGLTTEVAIGVIFASAVAIGALITPREDLVEALFGGFGGLSINSFILGMLLVLIVIYFLWKLRHKLVLSLFSRELASATKVEVSRLNLYFLLIFGLAIMLGLRFLGAILVGSLIIIPAAAAKQLTHTLKNFLVASAGLSVLSVVGGYLTANAYQISAGPTIVVVSAAVFALSLLKKKK